MMNTTNNQKYNSFTNKNLYDMSARFVDKLLTSEHKQLSDIFTKVVKNKEEQIIKVASLWQNIYVNKIKDRREYERDAYHIGLSQNLMDAWMKEFKASADEVFDNTHSDILVQRAKKIANDTHMLED